MSTEKKILAAACDVFIRKGMNGARMQEIADEAGINKALLHYYYRNKQLLFDAVFVSLAGKFFSGMMMKFDDIEDPATVIRLMVLSFTEMMKNNPFLPGFILGEINRDPQRLFKLFDNNGIEPQKFVFRFQRYMEQGVIVKMDARQLMVNILSMVIMPFVSAPLIRHLLYNNDKDGYDEFYESRGSEVADFVIKAIIK